MNTLTAREPVVYESQGLKIFGVIERPREAAAHPRPAAVMLHGFMAAKYQPPHRLFVQLAEALAQRGIVSLRVDLPGRGDSEGDTIDITAGGDLAAAQGALDILAGQPDVDGTRIAFVGLSWGGYLAASIAGGDSRVAASAILSCAPSERVEWRPTFQEVDGRRVNEFVGNLIGEQFYASLAQLTPLVELTHTRGPVLLMYGSQDEGVPSAAIAHAEQRLREAGVATEVVPIEGADHVFIAHAWQREVVTTTTAWLERVLSQPA
jgi:dipeptidyl aminopeptidase/acylaminoacyl peptidase